MDIFTLSHLRTLIALFCAASAANLLYSTANAEERRRNTNAARAELHIQVRVVHAVLISGHHRHHDADDESVAYNLEPESDKYSVTHETRRMLVSANGAGAREEAVLVTTVVAK